MAQENLSTGLPDTPEARRYNRIRRWLGIADFVVGFGLLILLLITGWTGALRDIAYRGTGQSYTLAVMLYVAMLVFITKVVGLGLEYYGFRLEHDFHLSNQKLGSWIWDQIKGFLLSTILAVIVAVVLYSILRQFAVHWWLLAWVVFLGLFVLMAQIAPVANSRLSPGRNGWTSRESTPRPSSRSVASRRSRACASTSPGTSRACPTARASANR